MTERREARPRRLGITDAGRGAKPSGEAADDEGVTPVADRPAGGPRIGARRTITGALRDIPHTFRNVGTSMGRMIAVVTPAGASVGLREVERDSPLGSRRGPDNLVAWTTARYHDRPMVVRGPGAGVEVTASAVLFDLLALG